MVSNHVCQFFISGVKCCTYMQCTHLHICTHANMVHHKHNMYSMILKPHSCMQHAHAVFFQDNDEDGTMAKYSDVRNGGRYVCGMIVV